MRRFGIICLILCYMLSFGVTFVTATEVQETLQIDDRSISAGCRTIDSAIPFLGTNQIVTNAEAAFLYETNSQTLMYAWNADAQLYPASFVKIMTALLAVERGNLSDVITVKKDVLDTIPKHPTIMKLYADEVVTLEQLLYCMLVVSANDAAAVIADHISGSQAAFVAEMNQYAEELGCTGTHFVDPHGLQYDQQYTTARDTARILAAAMEHEAFATILGTPEYIMDETNKCPARFLRTNNYLLNRDDVEIYYDTRVIGSRTGIYDNGDRCVASVAKQNGLQLICVVMGAKSEYETGGNKIKVYGGFPETIQLLDEGFENTQVAQVFYSGQAIKQQSVLNGSADVLLCPQIAVSTVVPAGIQTDGLTYRYTDMSDLQAPIQKGDCLSRVEVWLDDLCLAQADLFALNDVSALGAQNSGSDDTGAGEVWSKIAKSVGIIAVIFVAVVFLLRLVVRIRSAAGNHRSRRYRRSRRRSR